MWGGFPFQWPERTCLLSITHSKAMLVSTGESSWQWQAPLRMAVALRRVGASRGVAHDVCSRRRRTVRAHVGDADDGARTVELRTVATAVTRVLAAQLDQPQFAVDKLGMLPSETTTPDLVWVVRLRPNARPQPARRPPATYTTHGCVLSRSSPVTGLLFMLHALNTRQPPTTAFRKVSVLDTRR